MPGGGPTHELLSATAYSPAAQSTHELLPALPWYCPAAQSLHELLPVVPWYCPATQSLQASPPTAYLPAPQSAQSPDALLPTADD